MSPLAGNDVRQQDLSESEAASLRLLRDIREIDAADWDLCAGAGAQGERPENPFLTHRFLAALEESGSATAETGWAPHHLVLEHRGALLGVAPLYVKTHSRGEYMFDHAWADAFMRAGGRYYPKLQAAVPFTPAAGRRLLARRDLDIPAERIEAMLAEGACQIAEQNDLSSLHVTFCTEGEWLRLGAADAEQEAAGGLLRRQDQQFHWENRGYGDFEDFLATLTAKKRKNLRQERRKAVEGGVEILRLTGDAIEPEHWDAFWLFYQDTGMRKWGAPYLTREFFDIVQREMREDALLVMCRREGRWIAGALNFIGRDALYGRYWGCLEEHPCLHFETCYYQAIDAAIELGLGRVEAGAQGAHKIARGYEPRPTYSLHWIANPSFRRAIARYLEEERAEVTESIAYLAEHSPFRKSEGDESS